MELPNWIVAWTKFGLRALFIAACQFGMMQQANSEALKILMIGNSYTQGNASARATSVDLQGFFDGDPFYDAEITVRAESSYSLLEHARSSTTTNLITDVGSHWDVVVLQERSERPAAAMKFGGSELSGLDNGGPALIRDYIRAYQPHATVVLFSTWARDVDNEDLMQNYNNDPAEMLVYLDAGYERVRHNASAWDYSGMTKIAPVGDAWAEWYETYGDVGANNRLHLSDGSHQNNRGAYLAAAVLFETITATSSVGNDYQGAVTGNIGGISKSLLLQMQANATTGAAAGPPGDYNGDGAINAADYTLWRDRLGAVVSLVNDRTIGVDADDYVRWRNNFPEPSVGAAQAVVPEPTVIYSLACMAIAGPLQLRFRISGPVVAPRN